MNKSVNTIRFLAMDMINKANSGHPGAPLGFAPIAYTLFHDHLKITPVCSDWFDRDRFILASGHASSLLYTLLHLSGYNITIDDLKRFRQLGSNTPGHPELSLTDGVDCSSGPLGQGIATACGMAMAEVMLSKRFNKKDIKLIDHYTFVECGDGDFQEGVTLEALSLIGHLNLNKIIILYDSNKIQLDGPVSNAGGINNPKQYFKCLGFNYLEVNDPENINDISLKISEAKLSKKPTIIECHTIIGYGSKYEGTSKVHGSPLGIELTNELKAKFNYTNKEFEVDDSVYSDMQNAIHKNDKAYLEWTNNLEKYKEKYPKLYKEFIKVLNNDYEYSLKDFKNFEYKEEATRNAMPRIIDVISNINKTLVCGSADLTASTYVKGVDGNFDKKNRLGRNINYGIREHAMGAIANGLTLHHIRNLTGAFFVFSDYMKPTIRLASLMNLPTIFMFSHDSIAVGEDGPTHEPIEQIQGLRCIPNINLYRPSDDRTTVLSILNALNTLNRPSVILLTRQKLPLLEEVSYDNFKKGAFIRKDYKNINGTIVASGSEVSLALDASKILEDKGIYVRVVEMVSTNLFDAQSKEFKDSIIDNKLPSMFVEMNSTYGLNKYTKYTYGIDTFGVSAPMKDAINHFGFTKENIAKEFEKIIK